MQLAVRPAHLVVYLLIMAVWGSNFAMVKIGLEQMPSIFMVAVRFAIVAALLVPFVKPPRGRLREMALFSVVLGVLHFSMMFTGLRSIDAATAAISIQLQVPFAALLGVLVFGETIGWRRITGMLVAFSGVAIIAGEPRLDGQYGALALVLGAAMLWAVANILMKRLSDLSGWQINAWMALLAAPQLFVVSFLLEDGQWAALQAADWQVAVSLAYQVVLVVILGYGTWYTLLRRYDVNVAIPFTLLVPFFGVLSGIVILGEKLTPALIGGGILTIIGVGVVTIRKPKPAYAKTEAY